MGVLVFFLFLSLLATGAVSQQGECASKFAPIPNITCTKKATLLEKKYCRGTGGQHAFWVSSSSPIANAASRELVKEVDYFQNLYQNISIKVQQKRRRDHLRATCSPKLGIDVDDGGTTVAGYEMRKRWKYAALNDPKRIGLNSSTTNCFTQIQIGGASSIRIWRHFEEYNKQLKVAGETVLNNAKKAADSATSTYFDRTVGCFDAVYVPMSRNIKTQAFNCRVMGGAATRRTNSKFNLRVTLTDSPLNIWKASRERLYLLESWTIDKSGKKLEAVPIPSYKYGNISAGSVNYTTTALFAYGGSIQVTAFVNMPTASGPSMQYVEETTSKEQDGIFEGISLSNISILMFPCILTLLPISFFELSDGIAYVLIYAIATDILTVLPLAIKGIEMIVQTEDRHTRCVAWNVGSEIDSGLAVIELWCASCDVLNFFKTYGGIFVATSFVFMLTGLSIEYFTYHWAGRKKREIQTKERKWWERKVWDHGTCVECKCQYASSEGSGLRSKPFRIETTVTEL